MKHLLEEYDYIKQLIQMDKELVDRKEFHNKVAPLLVSMASDKLFMTDVLKRNFLDQGFLNQVWTGYNIPFLYVYETEHFNLKIHLFPPEEHNKKNIAAHCIHHHNNYMLTTNAFFGSGYETFLFEKNPIVNADSLDTNMKISKHFHQKDLNPSTVDSWEPHVVFIPELLSATLLIWTPDQKRSTDNLRQNSILKKFKKPLRWAIHKLGLTQSFGIAEEKTYQFYPNPNGKGFKGIEEGEYFAPTKAEKGDEVNDYSAQMLFAFIQRFGIADKGFFMKNKQSIPQYYHKFIDMILIDEPIKDVYHRTIINVPQKTYFKEDILNAQ